MMKCFLLLISCAYALGAPSESEPLSQHRFQDIEELVQRNVGLLLKNPIDKLWEEALEFVRTLLKTYEPLEVPEMPEQTVLGDGVSLKAKFKHVKISKASDFTIDNLDNHVIGFWAKFNVTVPRMHIEGDYTVSGSVKGKEVKSSKDGHFVIDMDQLKTGGYIKVALKGTYLEMSQFDMGYSLKGVKFEETGLEVDGMTDGDLKDLFNDSSLLKYFQDNEEFVCKQVGHYVMETANKIMRDKSLQGLLDWLRDVIDGKVIPTPPATP